MLSLAAVGASQGVQERQARAQDLYVRAMASQDPAQRAELLRQSLAEQKTLVAQLALAGTLLKLRKPAEAENTCWDAFRMARTDADTAQGLRCAAQAAEAGGDVLRAAQFLKRAMELARRPTDEDDLRRLTSTGVKSADVIVTALSPTAGEVSRVPGRAAVTEYPCDLYINFDFDSATLTVDGRRQVQELAKALDLLAASWSRPMALRIIGHTDARGTNEYNDTLSRRRAEAVRDILVREYRVAPALVTVEGRGKRERLFTGTTEDDHARNRRVEIVQVER
jgi:outer membrane protein OmpA-like peptidoglycan-associated protein